MQFLYSIDILIFLIHALLYHIDTLFKKERGSVYSIDTLFIPHLYTFMTREKGNIYMHMQCSYTQLILFYTRVIHFYTILIQYIYYINTPFTEKICASIYSSYTKLIQYIEHIHIPFQMDGQKFVHVFVYIQHIHTPPYFIIIENNTEAKVVILYQFEKIYNEKNYRKLIECRFLDILYKICGMRKVNWSIEKGKGMEV